MVKELFCLAQHGRPAVLVHPVPRAVDIAHARVAVEPVAVPVEKVPVEQVEGAGIRPCLVADLVSAGAAIIRHLLDKSDKTVKDFLEKTGEIKSSISGVDQQTRNLISVLNNNQSRGQWAEFQVEDLLSIMEYKDGIHYESQKIMKSGNKPDFTFYLPDNKTINMDSKFPLNLYMQLSKLNLDGFLGWSSLWWHHER